MKKEREIASQLKTIRRKKKMTLKDVAKRVGVDKSIISKVENGKVGLKVGMFVKICKALNLRARIDILYKNSNDQLNEEKIVI